MLLEFQLDNGPARKINSKFQTTMGKVTDHAQRYQQPGKTKEPPLLAQPAD
jgi:hypothetical protein